VFKGGLPAWGPLGEGNASLERAEPTRFRPDWGGRSEAAPKVSVTFVASGIDGAALARRLGTRRTLLPVHGLRGLTRSSLHANQATAAVEIDLRTGAVSLGGRQLAVEPVAEVPLSRRYLLR
jgi:urease subunit alpha